MRDAEYWIRTLNLQPHPEGGFYRETYRASDVISGAALPARFGGDRACSTAIYFLLRGGEFSALHRLKSDEIWHFYAGAPLSIHALSSNDGYEVAQLGPDPDCGQAPQIVVAAGLWLGACVEKAAPYSLVGCTVAPGFDFADFELGRRDELLATFSEHADVVHFLTREMGAE